MITDISTSSEQIYHASYNNYNYTKFTFKTEGVYKVELHGEFVSTSFSMVYTYLNNSGIIDTARDSSHDNSSPDQYRNFYMCFIRYFDKNK